jgi:hypothetical protein
LPATPPFPPLSSKISHPGSCTIKHYGLLIYEFCSKLVCSSKPVKMTNSNRTLGACRPLKWIPPIKCSTRVGSKLGLKIGLGWKGLAVIPHLLTLLSLIPRLKSFIVQFFSILKSFFHRISLKQKDWLLMLSTLINKMIF